MCSRNRCDRWVGILGRDNDRAILARDPVSAVRSGQNLDVIARFVPGNRQITIDHRHEYLAR